MKKQDLIQVSAAIAGPLAAAWAKRFTEIKPREVTQIALTATLIATSVLAAIDGLDARRCGIEEDQ